MKSPLLLIWCLALFVGGYFLYSSSGEVTLVTEEASPLAIESTDVIPHEKTRLPLELTTPSEPDQRLAIDSGGQQGVTGGSLNITNNEISAEELAELRAKNLVERRVRIEKQIRERSVRIADELGLGTSADEKIAKVYLEGNSKIEEIQAAHANEKRTPESNLKLRAKLAGIKDWHHEEFLKLFGETTAKSIENFRDTKAVKEAKLSPEDAE
ncbi:MAG: hypothetical protein ACI8X5_002625 [Planctomycetota bacterium]|jgi:hypothetical protein